MIVGVALVVDELHKGQRLVCRYPESIPSAMINADPGLVQFHKEYLNISPDLFAKFFRPKPALFNKVLEHYVDDNEYFSYPCPCADELSSAESPKNGDTDCITLFNVIIAKVRDSSLKRALGDNEIAAQLDRLRVSENGAGRPAGIDPVTSAMGLRGDLRPISAQALRKVVESFSRALLHQERRSRYVSRQVALMIRLQEDVDRYSHRQLTLQRTQPSQVTNAQLSTSADSSKSSQNDTSSANTISTNSIPGVNHSGGSSASSSAMTKEEEDPNVWDKADDSLVNQRLVAMEAMFQESSLANELRSLYHSLVGGYAVCLKINSSIGINVRLQDRQVTPTPVRSSSSNVFAVASVANKIGDIVDSSADNSNTTPSNTRRKSKYNNKGLYDRFADEGGLRPFHTLLLIAESDVVVMLMAQAVDPRSTTRPIQTDTTGTFSNACTALPPHFSEVNIPASAVGLNSVAVNSGVPPSSYYHQLLHPTLLRFIQNCNPLLSFTELASTLAIPQQQIFQMARQLYAWGLADVITTITASSRFQVNPEVSVETSSNASRVFAATFPCNPLPIPLEISMSSVAVPKHVDKESPSSSTAAVDTSFVPETSIPLTSVPSVTGRSQRTHSQPPERLFVSTLADNSASKHQPSPSSAPSGGAPTHFATPSTGTCIMEQLAPSCLARVLSVFDGARTLQECIELLPQELSGVALDVVVWLLRWRMLQEVKIYVVNVEYPAAVNNSAAVNGRSLVIAPPGKGKAAEGTSGLRHSFRSERHMTQYVSADAARAARRNAVRTAGMNNERSVVQKLENYLGGSISLAEICWLEGWDEEHTIAIIQKQSNLALLYCGDS